MKIRNKFEVDRPIGHAWDVLLDVPMIVPCLPGAELLEDRGNGEYLGLATVKIGPIQLQFRGTVVITEKDDQTHTVKLSAAGADNKGRGNASALSTFRLTEIDGGTQVDIDTDLTLTGSVAQYGRAAGLIQSIAQQIIKQFSENLRASLDGDNSKAEPHRPLSAIALGVGMLKSSIRRN